MKADLSDLEEINDVGPRVAQSLFEYFHDKEHQKLVEDLIGNGVNIRNTKGTKLRNTNIENKTFV